MTDKAKERIERACRHLVLRRLVHDTGEVSEFSKCEDCPAVFLTNRSVGGVMATAPVVIAEGSCLEDFTELELDSVLMRTLREVQMFATEFADEEGIEMDARLHVPNLLHLKVRLDRALLDAISDDETPCPHNGTRWQPEGSPFERCGQCGRVVEEIKA